MNVENSVIYKPKRYELCIAPISAGPQSFIELTIQGNLTGSAQVFAERLKPDGCTYDVISLKNFDNFEGCQQQILQNRSVNLLFQTNTVHVRLQALSRDQITGNQSNCEDTVQRYGSFTKCNRIKYDKTEVTTCDIKCRKNCRCILGDRELTSSCATGESNIRQDVSTILVYPIPAKILYMGRMGLTQVKSDAFRSLRGEEALFKRLIITENKLISLSDGLFHGLNDMYLLNLSYNALNRIQAGVFDGLTSLELLHLDNNMISILPDGVFDGLYNLKKIFLTNNRISNLQPKVFMPMVNLNVIRLRNNTIRTIETGAMTGMQKVYSIDLSFNKIVSLNKGSFKGLLNLEELLMQNNDISSIESGVFVDTPNLATLWLYGGDNNLIYASHESFHGLTNNTLVIVATAAACCFIREGSDAQCENKSPESPFLTCARLLPNKVLRVLMWILGICAFLGNIAVLYWRYTRKVRENPVQSFLITNLSISDLLMGVYMLIIASADVYFGSNFPPQAASWRNGFMCKFSGFIAMVSSEASVFFVTLISIDRLFRIKYTFSRFTMQEKSSYVVSSALWVLAVLIGVIAIILSVKIPDLYQMSEVCIGLPLARKNIHEDEYIRVGRRNRKVKKIIRSEPAMFFSMAVFLGLNLLCFLIVAICYLQIFIAVKKSSRKSGGKSDKEVKLAIKMAVIIWTDFCCWVPIAILGILVQTGAVQVSPEIYAWIVTFILPINSSVNPFLYTIATLSADRLRQRLSTIGENLTGTLGMIRTSS